MSRLEGNIFEAYWSVREVITKNPDVYNDPEYFKLLKVIEQYFNSYRWTSDEKDRLIWLYSGKGLNTATVASYLDMNINSYRCKVSRISTKLKDILFDGSNLSDICLSSDSGVVKNARIHIDHTNKMIAFCKEIPSGIFSQINATVTDAIIDPEMTEEDMFRALLFLTTYSNTVINDKLSQLNPAALEAVMASLYAHEYNPWLSYYKTMQDFVKVMRTPPAQVIQACKDEA